MITFQRLVIGNGGTGVCILCEDTTPQPVPATRDEINQQIDTLSHESVMMGGFEPFQHPDLVSIIESLTNAGARRIGMRTNGAALANPQNAYGCIEAGVRVFEIPLPAGDTEKVERLTGRAGLYESTLKGIAMTKDASHELDVTTFTIASAVICRHNSGEILAITGVAIAAGADAIRVECPDATLLDTRALNEAHSLATRAGCAFFGDGCEHFLEGASLYSLAKEDR